MGLFGLYNQKLSERKEIEDLSDGRFKRFKILCNKCADFIKYKFKKSDIALDEVKLNFIVEFEHYLRTVKLIGYNTSMKYMKDLKQVMKYGVMLEYIPSNSFDNFKCSYKKVKRDFLDQQELDILYWNDGTLELQEEFKMMLLNRYNKVIGIFAVSSGGIAGTVADPKLIFACALKAAASGIILAHYAK